MIRVLLLTEEPVLAAGLSSVLASIPTVRLDVAVGAPADYLELVCSEAPDVALLDFLPEHYAFLTDLKHTAPSCKLVLWVRALPIEVGCQTMRLGVRGILKKTVGNDILVKCLEQVGAGEFWFDKDLTAGLLGSRTVALTPRESQIVPLITQGLKNKEIAAQLDIAEATIRIYLSTLFRKLGVKDRYELAIYGMKNMLPVSRSAAVSESEGGSTDTNAPTRAGVRFLVLDKAGLAGGSDEGMSGRNNGVKAGCRAAVRFGR